MKQFFIPVLVSGFLCMWATAHAQIIISSGERVVAIDSSNRTCIDSEAHRLRLWARTMRLERNVGFLRSDKSFDVVISLRPIYYMSRSGQEDSASSKIPAGQYGHPVHISVIAGDGPKGFIEAGLANTTLAEGFPLKLQTEESVAYVGSLEIKVTLTKKEGTNDGVKILRRVVENIGSLPIPPNPYISGHKELSTSINGFLDSLTNDPKQTRPIRTGTIVLPFAAGGDPSACAGEFAQSSLSGGFMIVMEPQVMSADALGDRYVRTDELHKYCFKIDNAMSFIPRFAPRNSAGECTLNYDKMTTLANPYMGFVMLPLNDDTERFSSVVEGRPLGDGLSAPFDVQKLIDAQGISKVAQTLRGTYPLAANNLALCDDLGISESQCIGISKSDQ